MEDKHIHLPTDSPEWIISGTVRGTDTINPEKNLRPHKVPAI